MSYFGLRGIGLFGNGILGNVTISSNTTLAQDSLYLNLTINATFNLSTGNYRLFVKNVLNNNGTIRNNGASATVATGAPAITTTVLQSGASGGTGRTTTGLVGGTATRCIGGTGGAGGNGTPNARGAGGTVSVVSNVEGGDGTRNPPILKALPWALQVSTITTGFLKMRGGSGGGGGGGDGVNAGRGGGAGGGHMQVVARYVKGTGVFQALGGNGATASVGNVGGGGGAGGGCIQLITGNNSDLESVTFSAAGGSGGAGFGTGTAGTAGTAGNINKLVVGL